MPNAQPAIPDFLYGTAWKEDRTAALTELAIRSGFRAIDTANQRRHYFEAGVGQGLAAAYRAGMVTRADLFLQTKFTYQDGQDHRLPYDPAATLSVQVAQSMASSLEHLGTDHVDSFVLHGPASHSHWTTDDFETWQAMIKERDAGRTRLLGVSNISLAQLQQMARAHAEPPAFVQNRCYASRGWDREVRAFCREHNIIYQGFSLAHGKQLKSCVIPRSQDSPRKSMRLRPRLSSLSRARSACSRLPAPPAPITCSRTLKASEITLRQTP